MAINQLIFLIHNKNIRFGIQELLSIKINFLLISTQSTFDGVEIINKHIIQEHSRKYYLEYFQTVFIVIVIIEHESFCKIKYLQNIHVVCITGVIYDWEVVIILGACMLQQRQIKTVLAESYFCVLPLASSYILTFFLFIITIIILQL